MTLLVASIEGDDIWMMSDTAITGADIALRDREYAVKIEASKCAGLIGFAGDLHSGQSAIQSAMSLAAGEPVIQHLLLVTQGSAVDFAYAFHSNKEPKLVRVSKGASEEVRTLHLGLSTAFEQFQKIRHREEIDPAGQSLHSIHTALVGNQSTPEGLQRSLRAMLTLFAERQEHDVGGWVIAFVLPADGSPLFCNYASAVSDQVLDTIEPGDAIPRGTAEGGGFAISVNQLQSKTGSIAYWYQPGFGILSRLGANGFEQHKVFGRPAEFIAKVAELGETVELWQSDQPLGPITAITYLVDNQGLVRLAVLQSGNTMRQVWIQSSAEPFSAKANIDMERKYDAPVEPLPGIRLALGKDRNALSIETDAMRKQFSASEIDVLIDELAQLRRRLSDTVPLDPVPGSQIRGEIDPRWVVIGTPHKEVPGPLLLLRHQGLGWTGFQLPPEEAKSLGSLLQTSAKSDQATGASDSVTDAVVGN